MAGSGALYKIVLHEAYDELEVKSPGPVLAVRIKPVCEVGMADRVQHCKHSGNHVYALKAYYTDDAKYYYDNEVRAFKMLKRGRRPCPALINFYGSFVLNRNYYTLLEYADHGSLEDYFKCTQPPASGEDILSFWTRLLSVVDALIKVHNVEYGVRPGLPKYQG